MDSLAFLSNHLSLGFTGFHFVSLGLTGSPWRKRTRVVCWSFKQSSDLVRKWTGHNGIRSRSNQLRIVFTGTSPKSKKLWTEVARPYPPGLCRAYANNIANLVLLERITGFLNALK